MGLKIYKYSESFGRMGELEGLFVADEKDVAEAMGKEVNLGEALGKHSEVYATISDETVEVIGDDQVVIDFLRKHLHGCIGPDLIGRLADQEGFEE